MWKKNKTKKRKKKESGKLNILLSQEGQENGDIARSMGLNGPSGDAQAYMRGHAEPDDAEEVVEEREFSIECIVPEVEGFDNVHVQKDNPLCSAVFCKKAEFDAKGADLLVVRVLAAGPGSQVGQPKLVDSSTVRIPVTRANANSFISQMTPVGVSEERMGQFKTEVSSSLSDAFGKHVDVAMLDNAFRAMVPRQESWYIEATMQEPYRFRKMKKSRTICHPNGIDIMCIFPLETEVEDKEDVAPVISLSLPNLQQGNAPGPQ